MDEIYIHHHLGLGDHIICCGLVRILSKRYKNVFLFCKNNNLINVSFLYKDLPNIKIIPIIDDNDIYNNFGDKKIVQIGFNNLNIIRNQYNVGWDEAFYIQVNIPFKERWNSFYILRDYNREEMLFNRLNQENIKFCLIHSVGSDGVNRVNYDIINNNLLKIEIDKSYTNNIFDYLKLIENASEIHCIDSSFIHLVDSVDTIGDLYYHKNKNIRNIMESHTQNKNWKII